MGYIELTNKRVNHKDETIAIRIRQSTLIKLRRLFPAGQNETAASYFARLAGYVESKR